ASPLSTVSPVSLHDALPISGVTARVASRFARQQGARKVIVGAPVCAAETADLLRREVDQVICLEEPSHFFAVGNFYRDFSQLSRSEEHTSELQSRENLVCRL